MALSRAAAKAARQAAKSRGLKGNRGEDGSMLTGSRETHLIEEFGGQEKYPDIDANTPPAEIQAELKQIDSDIKRFEEGLEDLYDTNYSDTDPMPLNDFTIGLTERQLRDLKERKAFLEDVIERGYEAATFVSEDEILF
jgi:hypothetical protein